MVKMQYVLGSGKPRYSKTTTQQVESRCQGLLGGWWWHGCRGAGGRISFGAQYRIQLPGRKLGRTESICCRANLGTAETELRWITGNPHCRGSWSGHNSAGHGQAQVHQGPEPRQQGQSPPFTDGAGLAKVLLDPDHSEIKTGCLDLVDI